MIPRSKILLHVNPLNEVHVFFETPKRDKEGRAIDDYHTKTLMYLGKMEKDRDGKSQALKIDLKEAIELGKVLTKECSDFGVRELGAIYIDEKVLHSLHHFFIMEVKGRRNRDYFGVDMDKQIDKLASELLQRYVNGASSLIHLGGAIDGRVKREMDAFWRNVKCQYEYPEHHETLGNLRHDCNKPAKKLLKGVPYCTAHYKEKRYGIKATA